MRSLVSMFVLVSALAAFAVNAAESKNDRIYVKDRMSPERAQCIESCKSEKDTAAHEACLVKCPKDVPQKRARRSSASDKK